MGTTQRRKFWTALTNNEHKVTLVHSKHHGWLAIGLTFFAMGTAGIALSSQGQVVHASDQQPATQQTATNQGRVWKVRPVSQIEAQIKASGTGSTNYNIQWGDTLSTISEALNHTGFTTSVARLAAINRIANVDLIYAGAKLSLQGSGDNATVTTQDASGNNQTFNLNPAKPATLTPAQQAEAKYTVVGGSTGGTSNGGASPAPAVTPNPGSTDKDALQKQLEAIQAAKDKAEAEKAAAEKAQREAEAKLTALLNNENTETLAQLQAKRTAAQKAVDAAKAKVAATQEKLQAAQTAAQQAQTAADQTNAAVAAKQAAVEQSTAQVNSVSTQLSDLQNQLNTLADQVKTNPDSQSKVNETKAQLAVAQQKLTSYEGQLADATTALTQAKQTASQAGQKLTAATQAVNAVKNEATTAQNEFDQAETTLKALPTSVTSQNSKEAETVKTQLADLKAKVNQLDTTIDTLNAQIATWQDRLATAQGDAATAQTDLAAAKTKAEKVDTTDHQQTVEAAQTSVADAKKTLPTIYVPKNTDKKVTINKDENGQTLNNLDGYKLITAGTPVKSVQTSSNGDTITTYTTTNVYHKIAYQTVNKTVNVDQSGNALTNTDGYTKVSVSRQAAESTDPKTGDVTTTVTLTTVWKKTETPTHTTVNKTVNVDQSGKVLTSTDGYTEVSRSSKSEDTKDNAGNITTTVTTTIIWKKNETPTHTTVNKTVNVDQSGKVLTSTDGYTEVSRSSKSEDTKDNAGNITTTVTTTIIWKKNETPTHTTVNKTVNVDQSGKVLTSTAGYTEISRSSKSEDTKDNAGNITTTVTTTIVWKKNEVTTPAIVNKTVNVDEAGNVLTSVDNYSLVNSSKTSKEDPSSSITTFTTTNVWKKNTDPNETIINKFVNVDDQGHELTSTDGYVYIGGGSATSWSTTSDGHKTTTVTYTSTYHKPQAKTVTKEVDVDEGGITLDDKTGYVKISSTPITTVSKDPNTWDTTTTITTKNVWRNVEAAGTIIGAIKSINDATTQLIQTQIEKNDRKVSIEQAAQYTDKDLTMAVIKKFNVLINGEQKRTGHVQTSLTSDPKAYEMEAPRAVEVMFKFSHTRPVNAPASGTEAVTYQKGEPYMSRNTENISISSLWKKDVDGSADKLSTLIAEAMFKQYIVDERPENNNGKTGGHYQNIINSGYKNIVIGVYVVDRGLYYAASTAVATGNDGTFN
ncbi:LysM peptidoglycan-binding domain-containing protein [Lacticaseibacillus rhamnosus]|uniref:LysM peptidoglycan-binding domain-containing protein n=1 Tax=Lacticaseibacillus rhamnosus TaxID=47715 RepID=UPI0022EBC98B|nr:LysM peptidoglycan-binding domain-containing protein [Lacticaseibacillus rhamnosus]MDA3727839.1 LysM peptidoglycan-binding domain-containing protein [Lacticaseibacillus rhamnosus]MDA3738772.1 LysM peptidoglycan-binding domain-containing protein [Lacticaseibacillus rhamnosus]MDA3744073.1 LysM peptidoglycan-binding domain-containing protein [Lacticaseibacillus rhamnosus]MDA3746742.1 LysM peptidoglycan-binding domain-containing protein [Lacticaseibacillus rhamnosus]MDA3752197.1 LysM peptidogly